MGAFKIVKISVLCVSLSLLSISSSFAAGVRGDSRDVFSSPATGGWTQVLLGLVELGVATAVWPGLTAEENSLRRAQQALADAEILPTTHAQKNALIEQIMVDSSNYENSVRTGKAVDL